MPKKIQGLFNFNDIAILYCQDVKHISYEANEYKENLKMRRIIMEKEKDIPLIRTIRADGKYKINFKKSNQNILIFIIKVHFIGQQSYCILRRY